MSRAVLFLILFALSFAFAQDGGIKFQIPQDSIPAAPPPAPLKLGPLNLAELSAKDTASVETYTRRRILVQDSITAMHREIENTKKRSQSQMPLLEPKGEYEKQAQFDARKAKWENELGEKILRDSKPLKDRLAELESAKKKIDSNRASLYCSVVIKTSPEAALIYFNKEKIGASPTEYSIALPGHTLISIQKDGYEPWDTTLTLLSAQKLKINVALQEKSIFSKEGEIDFPKILAKDTTVEGYRARMGRVTARIKQIDNEIKTIVEDFSNTYPALEPQRQQEPEQDFVRRRTEWNNEGIRRVGVLRYKHEAYRNQLVRSLKVLEDCITATELKLMTETPPNANITLGAYDVEREVFEITVEDTANAKSPFFFSGTVGIPQDTAIIMNRSTDGFIAGVSYISYPFVSEDSSFNLAMKELFMSRKAVPLKVQGTFKPIGRFEEMEGYGTWRAHADSLLNGALKVQGLDLDYALKGEKAKEAAEAAGILGGGGLSWRGWTRILAFSAAATCGTLAVVKYLKAKEYKDEFSGIYKTKPELEDPEYDAWYYKNHDILEDNFNKVKDNKSYRTIYGIFAGIFTIVGGLTYVF